MRQPAPARGQTAGREAITLTPLAARRYRCWRMQSHGVFARPPGPTRALLRQVTIWVVALALLGLLVSTAPAGASSGSDQSQLDQTRAQLAAIEKKLAASKGQQSVIQSQVSALNKQIDTLNRQLGVNTQSVYNLKTDIDTDNRQIAQLQAQEQSAQSAADTRARSIYEAGPAQTLTSLLSARSIGQLERQTVVWQIASQIDAKVMIQTRRLKDAIAAEQADLQASESALQAKEGALSARGDLLNSAKAQRQAALDAVNAQITQELKDEQELTQESIDLTNALQNDASLSHGSGAVSGAGLAWPVHGPITSPFGPRRGGFHYGIDIGASTGTPIHAAKEGTVLGISCGTGYGICTIIDNGNGVSTLYAHMSRKIISGGHVSQGEVIGDVGCTGYCTGPHLHFEVRINGAPNNPMNYLP